MSLSNDLLNESMPKGFTLIASDYYDFVITYKRTGMVFMNLFIIFFLGVWSIPCLLFTWILLLNPISGFFVFFLVFWIPEIIVLLELIKFLFCHKTFYFETNQLIIKTNILGIQWKDTIKKKSIKGVYQVKDGGGEEDSFPSWGLKVVAHDDIILIYRQPYKKSYWLGQFIADWAGINFSYYNRKDIKFLSSIFNKYN